MVPFGANRPLHYLMVATVVLIALSAYQPVVMFDWYLENLLVAVMVLFLAVTYRSLPLSTAAYVSLFLFLIIHEWGAHHKYSDVPLGEWMKGWLQTERNHYDRVSHFSFGLFFAAPIQEIFMRTSGHRGFWSYLVPVEFALAAGAIYEIIEMIVAELVTPGQGEDFVGMQGDMWDAQKDTGLAGLGALIAVILLSIRAKRRSTVCL